jgi:hypothetical protein
MSTLKASQEELLGYLVDTVLSASALVASTPKVRRRGAMTQVRTKHKRNTRFLDGWDGLDGVAYRVQIYLETITPEQPDPDGTTRFSRDDLMRGLEMVITQEYLAIRLAQILAWEQFEGGWEKQRFTLRAHVEAGLALAELGEIDPSFAVAKPGIEMFYDRLISGGDELSGREGQGVLDVLKRTVSSALVGKPA